MSHMIDCNSYVHSAVGILSDLKFKFLRLEIKAIATAQTEVYADRGVSSQLHSGPLQSLRSLRGSVTLVNAYGICVCVQISCSTLKTDYRKLVGVACH